MNLYQRIKAAVTTRQAAENYGLKVSPSGMALCPFHDDHHPSLKLDKRYYCFGCGEQGDVIDFTARYLGVSPHSAAIQLARDFGIDPHPPAPLYLPNENAEPNPDEDANTYGELVFDVNSAYFYNHGGYEFAKQFYADAYKAAVEIVGGEQYILSAVMHADERNRAMSEALDEDVFHYHLHVVYIPVVEKQIRWSKRCKDKSLVGTVKETIMQVSSSKKWISKPTLDEDGNPVLNSKGKPILRKSYSVLQDDFYNAMRDAGYTDVERGERGSTEEHLTVTQFKVQQEAARLEVLEDQTEKKEQQLQRIEQKTKVKKSQAATFEEIDSMGRKTFTGKVELTAQEASYLKEQAKRGISAAAVISDLKKKLEAARQDSRIWKERYESLQTQTKDFLVALKKAPEAVKTFLSRILHMEKKEPEQEKKQRENALVK